MPTRTPPDMHARAQTLPLATDPLPNSGSQFYRPPGAPLRPTSLPAELPEDPAYSRRLVYCAALAGLLTGLVLGFCAAWLWLAAGWMWAQ